MSFLFLECHSFSFHAITKQAAEFVSGLDGPEWEKLAAAAELLARGYRSGRPLGGRSQRIRGSSVSGLFELKITAAGSKGPQLRLLAVREGSRVLCVRGVTKRQPRIPRREIELAERAILAHRCAADEPGGVGKGPG